MVLKGKTPSNPFKTFTALPRNVDTHIYTRVFMCARNATLVYFLEIKLNHNPFTYLSWKFV